MLDTLDDGDLAAASQLVEKNRAALAAARLALGQRCAVEVRFDESFFAEHSADFSLLRDLARTFRAEALLAMGSGSYGSAAQVAIDLLDLANAVRRGGLITDLLVGMAISGMGIDSLRKIRASLDETTRQTVISNLQRCEDEREPFADIAARDRVWELAVGFDDQSSECPLEAGQAAEEGSLTQEESEAIQQLIQQFSQLSESELRRLESELDYRSLALSRLLMVDLAVRSWSEKCGTLPQGLSCLVPEILPQLPLDPFSSNAFVYRTTGRNSFLLYGTGPSNTDHGGVFADWLVVAAGGADLCLDMSDYHLDCCVPRAPRGFLGRTTSRLQSWWRSPKC